MPLYQDVDAKLTLTRVATAPALIAEVAKLTGQKLEVSPTLATEVLMVSVEDARVADVLTKLAVAATAVWQPMEGGYRLVPDVAARTIEASSERARRLYSITEGLKKKQAAEAKRAAAAKQRATARTGAAVKADDDDEDEVGVPDFSGMFGGGGGTDAFIPMLDLSVLANMEAGDRVVFATNPNGAQRPLRGNPAAVVNGLIATHNKTAKAMGATNSEGMPDEMAALMNGFMGDRMKRMSRPITAAPTKIVVVASRGANPMFGGLGLDVRIEARAYGANGAVLIEETGTLDTDLLAVFAAMAQPKKPAAAGKSTPIVYSEDAKAFLASVDGDNPFMSGGFGKGQKYPQSLHAKLFGPDKFDPLAIVPGEGLVALAKARRKPLVASIPDAAYPGMINDAPPKTVEDVEESVKTGPMRLVPDTTFLVVRAAEPETARRTRVDRLALAKLMAAVADHETPNLDELSEFATKSPPPSRSDLLMSYISRFVPNAMGSMQGLVSWDALRLYAALNPVHRQSLASGGKIPFANLSPAAHAALRSMLYGADDNLTVERAGVSNEPDIFSISMQMMMGGGGIDAQDEPTEVAPRGLPSDGYLQAAVTQDTVLRPIGDDGPIYYSLGTDELAMIKMFSSSGISEAEEAMRLPDAARLGSRTLWNLRGYVAPGAYVGGVLNDDRTPKNGTRISLSNLPADLQTKVAQKVEKLKKSPMGTMISLGMGAGKSTAKP